MGGDFTLENNYNLLIAGVDEAGRGPLAGPVVAAAVILDPAHPIAGLDDSKKLTAKRREALFVEIQAKALAWSIARSEPDEIDEINILQATLVAMQRAVAGLALRPQRVLVDGNRAPTFHCPAEAIVQGDATVAAISAASILAKVSRDREMQHMESLYPGYGFAQHKGYPSRLHIVQMAHLGITPIHRKTFAPVRRVLAEQL